MLNKIDFAESVIGGRVTHFQREVLESNSFRKVVRAHRRSGKTMILVIEALYELLNGGMVYVSGPGIYPTNYVVNYIKKFANMEIKQDEDIHGIELWISRDVKRPTMYLIDEVAYHSDRSLKFVESELLRHPEVKLVACGSPEPNSNPKQTKFYKWCHADGFDEFYLSYKDSFLYSSEDDERFQNEYSEEKYRADILAKF